MQRLVQVTYLSPRLTFSLCLQTLGGEEHLKLHSCVELELLNNFNFQVLFLVASALSNKLESKWIILPISELGGFASFSKSDPANLEKV